MKAIETEYAGYRFRSRLEARWAVFFDEAEIAYQYEPEGFTLPWALTPAWGRARGFQYLPDFWLPELKLWGEVKGSWTQHDSMKTLNAFYAMDQPTLLLPDVFRQPRKGSTRPWLMECAGPGILTARGWPLDDDEPLVIVDNNEVDARDLLRGYTAEFETPDWYRPAARAAQRARFEFGETPGREMR